MLPFLSYMGGKPLGAGSDEDKDAMHWAMRAYHNRGAKPHSLADQLEAGILGGRPFGEALPPEADVPSASQRCYELMYFDVRDHLQDRAWIIRHVLAEMQVMEGYVGQPVTVMQIWGRRARQVAYAMGYDEYVLWRDGTPSDGTRLFLELRNRLDRYLTGLWELGLEGFDDGLKAFEWLLRQADRIRSSEVLTYGDIIRTNKESKGEMRERRRLLNNMLKQVPPPAWRPPREKRRYRRLPGGAPQWA
jgi:hypothetical protein